MSSFFPPTKASSTATEVIIHPVTTRMVLVKTSTPPKRMTAPVVATIVVPPPTKKRRQTSAQGPNTGANKRLKPNASGRTTPRSLSGSSASPPSTRAASRASSRRASTTPAPLPTPSNDPIPRPCGIDQDGNITVKSAADVVRDLMSSYKSYFRDPEHPEHNAYGPDGRGGPPQVTLEMPNTGASEVFTLLQPKDPDHYNPIFDLRGVVHAIIDYFVPQTERWKFGTPTDQITLPSDMNIFCHQSDPIPDPPIDTSVHQYPYGNITHGIAMSFNRCDGPAFVKHINNFNKLVRELKCDSNGENLLMKEVKGWLGVSPKLVKAIVEQTYQRCVGPRIKDLRSYTAFSSNVYGELMPNFISDIILQTSVRPGSHVLDLGCGVGNVVLQAALQAGCTTAGIEVMKKPAALGKEQLAHLRDRLRLWGVSMGDAEVIEGDFREHNLVHHLQRADVVVVNNYAFEPRLNDELSRLFLDLKEGAVVISLKPFVPSNWRLKEFNAESPVAILRVEERDFLPGMVSWCVKGGTYYLNYIDRSMLREFAEHGATTSTRSTRGTRRTSR